MAPTRAGPELRIAPVAIGMTTAVMAATLIATLGDVADLVVVSTDLGHYLSIEEARRRDAGTAAAILARDAAAIDPETPVASSRCAARSSSRVGEMRR